MVSSIQKHPQCGSKQSLVSVVSKCISFQQKQLCPLRINIIIYFIHLILSLNNKHLQFFDILYYFVERMKI